MAIPPDIRIRLEQLRGEMAAKAEAQRRQQQAQANAEKMSKQFVPGKAKGGEANTPSIDVMKLALNKQGMYSPLEKAAMSIPRTKGTPAEFMAEISKQPGFRKDEVEDRKISLPEGKMTKQEFLEHVQKNHPSPRLDEQIYHSEDEDEGDQTKYGDYQLPGGQNYREVLLKTPQQGLNDKERDRKMWLEANQRRGSLTIPEDNELMKLQIKEKRGSQDYQSSHWMDERNVLAHMRLSDRYVGDTGNFAVMGTKGGKTRWLFTTGINGTPEQAQQAAKKWEDQGYETSINQVGGGKKLLHIEEIQSDWHQEGRKRGYTSPETSRMKGNAVDAGDGTWRVEWPDGTFSGGYNEASARAKAEEGKGNAKAGVPDAPFKKNWHELALKHAIGIAAREGYDGIVITPGEQQADRYDLSKHVQNIYHSANADGTFHASVLSPRGQVLWEDFRAPPEKIEATLGKDIAHKIVNGVGEEDNGMRRLDPEDMKVGGEGMKGFYDKIVPAYLNKLGKPHGAQVQMYGMPVNAPNQKSWGIEDAAKFHGMTGSEYLDHPDRPQLEKQFLQARQNQTADLHYFPITDSMRQQIKTEGLPQYDKGGKVDPIEQMRRELAANGRGPIGMDALKQNVQGAWQVLKDVPGNLKRLATDPVAYIRSLPAPTGEQIMNMAGPGNIGFAGMMIGPKARTWHTGRAQMAEAMEAAGRTPEEIWKATGTLKGPDGIWRQEISDKGSTFNMIDDLKLKAQEYKDMIEAKKALLAPDKSGQKDFWPKALTEAKRPVREEIAGLKGDLSEMSRSPRTQGVPARWTLDHPELYAAYPELADLPVIQNYKTGPEKGSLYTGGGKLMNMEVNDPRMPRSIALHEMQHAIQNIEGMTPGANPLMALGKPEWKTMYDAYKKAELAGMPPGSTLPTKVEDQIAQKAAMRWYQRQHGEAEARGTQARRDMSDVERAQSFPYNSYDVSPSDFLTRDPIPYTGKVSEARGGTVHPLLPDFEE